MQQRMKIISYRPRRRTVRKFPTTKNAFVLSNISSKLALLHFKNRYICLRYGRQIILREEILLDSLEFAVSFMYIQIMLRVIICILAKS